MGDDCTIIRPPAGQLLCCSMDTMVEGVHFPDQYPAKYAAYRALGAALSDLAAMGASPSHFTLSLTLPEADTRWLEAFSSGLQDMASAHGVALVGGDLTRGPLTIAIQVHGWVPEGEALMRAGAQPGDLVVVTGDLGAARAALELLALEAPTPHEAELLARYHRPEPRLQMGCAMRPYAKAALDISDGLVADAAHLARASSCRVVLDATVVPVSPGARACFPDQALDFALYGGDDYELLMTMRPDDLKCAREVANEVALTCVGHIEHGQGVQLLGAAMTSGERRGFQHFG